MENGKTSFEKFELKFIREYQKSFWFEIPETRNRIFLPKSQCKVETETFDLEENNVYNVHVPQWLADEKKIKEGGEKEEQKIVSIDVELIDDRPKAMKVRYIKEDISFWLPKSQVLNVKEFKKKKDVYQMTIAEWLIERKLKEVKEEKSGRMMVGRTIADNRYTSKKVEPNGESIDVDDTDIPF